MATLRLVGATAAIAGLVLLSQAEASPDEGFGDPSLGYFWPETDFERHSVDFDEIVWGGVSKDQIRSIDDPIFAPVSEIDHLADREPVIGLGIEGDFRAYPLQILTRHEIVNDVVGGVPVAVTYCPLCNTAVVFDRRVDGRVLEFGVSGFLRNSDLIMYDRQTETWWQQFAGEAIVGELTGTRLEPIPARLESFAHFRERAPDGLVLVPAPGMARGYGINPYEGYDSRSHPYEFYRGEPPSEVPPLERVVRVGEEAWSLSLLQAKKEIVAGDLIITWEPGQASALDTRWIADGFDVGNVVVQRKREKGLEDVVYAVDFAFAFRAFYPSGIIHTE